MPWASAHAEGRFALQSAMNEAPMTNAVRPLLSIVFAFALMAMGCASPVPASVRDTGTWTIDTGPAFDTEPSFDTGPSVGDDSGAPRLDPLLAPIVTASEPPPPLSGG